MPDTIQFFFWFLGVPAAVVACLLLKFALELIAWHFETATAQCQSRLAGWRMNTNRSSLHQQDNHAFIEWLAARTGTGSSGAGVDQRLVEAQKQAELIRVLVEEEIPKTVLQCVETHRLTAAVAGACHLFEIAYEPDCAGLRAKVIWLLAHTVRYLDAYPLRLDDPRLLHNSIVLRKRALPICRRCPYIQLAVDQAPRLCPTAELVQLRGAEHEAKR